MKRWLTSAQAADYLGLSESALSHRVARRQIPFTRIGDGPRAQLRFDVHELDAMLESRTVPVGGVTP